MREIQDHTLKYVVVDVPAPIWKQHRFRAWLVFDGHNGQFGEFSNSNTVGYDGETQLPRKALGTTLYFIGACPIGSPWMYTDPFRDRGLLRVPTAAGATLAMLHGVSSNTAHNLPAIPSLM